MSEEQKPCGRMVCWWDGEYEGECERPVGHWGFHHDGLSWYTDDGEMHDPYCLCWCHIQQPDSCHPGWSQIGGNILKSCGCSAKLFEAIEQFYANTTESFPVPWTEGPKNE